MKKAFSIACCFLFCGAAHAAANDHSDFSAVFNGYSCMQLAALNEVLLDGARESQSVEQEPNLRHVYISTSTAAQKPSLKVALLEQAEAAHQLFIDKQCLAD